MHSTDDFVNDQMLLNLGLLQEHDHNRLCPMGENAAFELCKFSNLKQNQNSAKRCLQATDSAGLFGFEAIFFAGGRGPAPIVSAPRSRGARTGSGRG